MTSSFDIGKSVERVKVVDFLFFQLVRCVVGKFLCKMIPKSSYCFLCFMVSVVVWFGLQFRIHVYCLECAMRMLRLSYLF